MAARNVAGPGVILSFIIAAIAAIFSGKSLLAVVVMGIKSDWNLITVPAEGDIN